LRRVALESERESEGAMRSLRCFASFVLALGCWRFLAVAMVPEKQAQDSANAGQEEEAEDVHVELVAQVAGSLHAAIQDGNVPAITKMFGAFKESPATLVKILGWREEKTGVTAYHLAARDDTEKGVAVLRLFMSVPMANLSTVDRHGQTPCHVACERGNADGLGMLLKNISAMNSVPCDLSAAMEGGKTCLHLAAASGRESVLDKLIAGQGLRLEESLNARTLDGKTALWLAVNGGYKGTARWLSAKGAEVDLGPTTVSEGEFGARSLAHRRLDNYTEIVQLIMAHEGGAGADS